MRQQISSFAKGVGFDLVGFTSAKIEDKYLQAFDEWLTKNNHASMQYMEKIEQRRDLTKILPGAASVIVLALNYYRPQKDLGANEGRVARYAYGRDYHKVIKSKLKKLIKYLNEIAPDHQHKAYVDTGPVLERALAEQAGIGAIGKNTCLITKEFGSWVFLAEVITTLDLNSSKAEVRSKLEQRWQPSPDQDFKVCGNCTRCMDACPTGAIIAPGVVDSRLCISYLTIENKDDIPPELAEIIAKTKRIYGCDICQEVCPHNTARQITTHHGALTTPKIAGDQLSSHSLSPHLSSDQKFLEQFAGSPLMRAKRTGIKRNISLLGKTV